MELTLLTKEELPENALTISHSRMMLWQRCPFKYWLSYESGRERVQRQNRPMLLGTIGHKCMDIFYTLNLNRPVQEMTGDEFDKLCLDINEQFDHDSMSRECCIRATGIFYKYQQWAGRHDSWIPLATEIETYVYLGKFRGRPVYFHVIIDLLAEEDGELVVVDHKWTGKFWDETQVYFDTQLPFYMNMLRKAGIAPGTGVINGINTYQYQKPQHPSKLFQRTYVHHTEQRLANYHDELMLTVKHMLQAEEYPKHLQKDCAYCGFNEICNASLRGIPTDDMLSNFDVDDSILDVEVDID